MGPGGLTGAQLFKAVQESARRDEEAFKTDRGQRQHSDEFEATFSLSTEFSTVLRLLNFLLKCTGK